jgi:hypothetical protein
MFQHRDRLLVPAPPQCQHAGAQLLEGKGFDQVIIGAIIQPADPLLHAIQG